MLCTCDSMHCTDHHSPLLTSTIRTCLFVSENSPKSCDVHNKLVENRQAKKEAQLRHIKQLSQAEAGLPWVVGYWLASEYSSWHASSPPPKGPWSLEETDIYGHGYVCSSKSDIAWKCECYNAKCVYGVNVKQVCGGELSEEKPSRH